MMEKRHFERYRCDVDITIIDRSDDEHAAEACDISEEGICLLIPRSSVMNLLDAGSRLESGNGLKIIIPDIQAQPPCTMLCSIAHASSVQNGQYIIGLHFEDDSPKTRSFVRRQLNHFKAL